MKSLKFIKILAYFQQAAAEKERKRKEEVAKNQMKPASTDSEDSDDELDIELKRFPVINILGF